MGSPLTCVCVQVSLYDTQRHSGYEILMTWLQQTREMSLTGEGIVLSAGGEPDIPPPFLPADLNILCEREQREQAVIVLPDMIP